MKLSTFLGRFLLVTLVSACSSSSEDDGTSGYGPSAGGPGGSGGASGSSGASSGGSAGSAAGGSAGTSAAGSSGSPAGGGGGAAAGGGAGASGASGTGGSGGAAGGGGSGEAGAAGGEGGASGGASGGAGGSGGDSAGGASGGGGVMAGGSSGSAGGGGSSAGGASGGSGSAGMAGAAACGTPTECAATWEQAASDHFDSVVGDQAALAAFLKAVPKGGDLHNHLSGAVYAETYLGWAKTDGDCVNTSTFGVVYKNQCSSSTQPVPTSGAFYDDIVHAWSMKDFVPGAETGHDHFFSTFGKFGAVAGAHRDDSLADVATRAADENVLYVETMFNMGKNVGSLAASLWSGTLTAADLPAFYDKIVADPAFAANLTKDVGVANTASAQYRAALGCDGLAPPAACDVGVRFVAQVSRTGANDTIFGQLVSAFEMAAKTDRIVAANLSSPEDDTSSLKNYDLHMAMLDFLHGKYADTKKSPLHITLHAGELTPKYLPAGYETANTFHIRAAVEKGHAERIGHGLDVLSETDAAGLLVEMAQKKVMVEVCLSSNVQILEVSGAAHPLSSYIMAGVPVALATDDQGVSRSSLAGEYARAALDQKLTYRQLKAMARQSLEHAFLPGDSLWASINDASPAASCAPTDSMGLGDTPNQGCQAFLDGSEKARMQWALEGRFRAFESGLLSRERRERPPCSTPFSVTTTRRPSAPGPRKKTRRR